MGTAERREHTIKSILNRLDQAIERISLKIDGRNLIDGTYRSRYDHQLYQSPSYRSPPHRSPPHHPPPRYHLQHPQFTKYFYEEELRCSIYHCNDDYGDRGMFYDRQRRFINPNPSRRSEFSNPNRRDKFSNSIPSFDGSLDVESIILWIDIIDGLFDMEYIPMEDQAEFVAYKLKRRAVAWRNQFQNIRMYQGKSPIRMWRRMKRLL